jgi:hypothetical protein
MGTTLLLTLQRKKRSGKQDSIPFYIDPAPPEHPIDEPIKLALEGHLHKFPALIHAKHRYVLFLHKPPKTQDGGPLVPLFHG